LITIEYYSIPSSFIFAPMKIIIGLVLLCAFCSEVKAQDTLPNFNIRDINDKKILITWINPFSYHCVQLAVQRSFDSTQFFSTIYAAQSPELPQNGVVDLRMPKGVKVFYRIFYSLDGGKYYFTKSIGLYSFDYYQKLVPNVVVPQNESSREISSSPSLPNNIEKQNQPISVTPNSTKPIIPENIYINIYRRTIDTLLFKVEEKNYKHLRDSIITKTKDTLFNVDKNNLIIKPFVPKPVWKPSSFVFTNEKSNNVELHFLGCKQHKYHVIFYDEGGKEFFQLKNIKDPVLTLDNSNFMHAGWFTFDVYEDDKLKEHNKLEILLPF